MSGTRARRLCSLVTTSKEQRVQLKVLRVRLYLMVVFNLCLRLSSNIVLRLCFSRRLEACLVPRFGPAPPAIATCDAAVILNGSYCHREVSDIRLGDRLPGLKLDAVKCLVPHFAVAPLGEKS